MPRDIKRGIRPRVKSNFLKVACPECNNEMIVFSACSTTVKCNQCGALVAQPTGGQARILGKVVEVQDRSS